MSPTEHPALVGRRPHLARLLAEATSAGAGTSRATLLVGDAGIGKTRLITEYLDRTPLGRSATGACLELGTEGIAYAPFAAVLRQLVRDCGAGNAAGGELARLVPGLGEAPEVTEESRARLFEAVLTFLEERAHPDGLAVVVEDLHWSDASTRDLLVFLLRNLETASVHLVVSIRSDDLHRTHPLRRLLPELERLPRVSRLDLEPLSRDEVAEQAAALGHRTDPDLLLERSGGNPLFVESFLSDPEPLGIALPDGPRDLLLRAVEPLPEATRQVLGLASVAGGRVDHVLLAEVADRTGFSEEELDKALRPAIDARVLSATDDRYQFRHALLAEAVYADLLPGERVRAHRRYADVLEQGVAGQVPGETAAQLARHAHAVHDHPRALTAAWAAAEHAAATTAHPEHLALLERVLELWELVPDAAERLGLPHGELLRRACLVASVFGSTRRAAAHATAGLRETDSRTDPELTAGLLLARGRVLSDLGRANALDDLRAAADLLPEDHPGRPPLDAARANALMRLGRDEEAERTARRAIAAAQRAGDQVSEVDALMTLANLVGKTEGFTGGAAGDRAHVDSEIGDGEAVAAMLRRAVDLARRSGQVRMEVRAWRNLSAHLYQELRIDEAYRAAETGQTRCAELGVARSQGLGVGLMMAGLLSDMGHLGRAEALLARLPNGQPRHEAHRQDLTALFHGFQGRWDQAEEAIAAFTRLMPRDVSSPMEYLNHYYARLHLRMYQGRLIEAAGVVERAHADIGMLDPGRFPYHGLAVVGELVARLRRQGDSEALGKAESLAELLWANLNQDRGRVSPLGRLGRTVLLGFLAEDPAESLEHLTKAIEVAEAARYEGMMLQAASGAVHVAHALGEHPRARALLDRLVARTGHASDDFTVMREIAELRALLGPEPARSRTAAAALPAGVTPREAEVLAEVAKGSSNREVGEALFISAKTVSVHLTNLMGKLGVDNRTAAVAKGRELGLL